MSPADKKARPTNKRGLTGVVKSVSGDKTISVIVNRLVKHPLYGKYMRRRTKLAVHDENNQARVGETVEVVPCRPLSKTKSWRLLRVLRSGPAGQVQPGGER